jgi:large subunit ribosomal protein L17
MASRGKLYKLGRNSGQRKALFRGLVRSLVLHERIRTTAAKAKAVKPLAERMITWGCRAQSALENDESAIGQARALHLRRQAFAFIQDNKVIGKVFEELAPRYRERPGGYTRILKIGARKGDAAPVVLLEFV